jgi:hypothetical protein
MSPAVPEISLKALRAEILRRQIVPPEPAAQVGHPSNLATAPLPSITLLVQKRRVGVDMSAQRTFMQTLKCLGMREKVVGHVFSFGN